jgi:hypothetical protein
MPVEETFISGELLDYTLNWGDTLTISFDVVVSPEALIGSIMGSEY